MKKKRPYIRKNPGDELSITVKIFGDEAKWLAEISRNFHDELGTELNNAQIIRRLISDKHKLLA